MNIQQQIELSRHLCLTSYFGLLISLAATQLVTASLTWPVLLIQMLPLLLCLPGMLKGNGKAFVWLGCLLLFYSAKFFSDLIITSGAWLSIIQTTLALIVFSTALLHVRWRGIHRKRNAS